MNRSKYKQLESDIVAFRPELSHKVDKSFRWNDTNCVSIVANEFASISDVHYLYSIATKEVGFHVHKLIYKPLFDLLKSNIQDDRISFEESNNTNWLGYIKLNQKIDIDKEFTALVDAFKFLFDLFNPIILDYIPTHKDYNDNVWFWWHGDQVIEHDYLEVSTEFEGYKFSDFKNAEEFKKKYKKERGNFPSSNIPASECEFTNDVKIGDIIVAFKTNKGHKYIYGWGNITSDIIPSPDKKNCNIRKILWVEKYASAPLLADFITSTYFFQKPTADQLYELVNMLNLDSQNDAFIDAQLDKLIKFYKAEHKKKPFCGYDESYKWKLLSDCENCTPIEVARKINEDADFLLYKYCVDTINKFLIDNEEYKTALENLCDESIELGERIEEFNKEITQLCPDDTSKPNDERSAATILTCMYPEKYAFFMYSRLYAPFCSYLGLQPVKLKWHSYGHYMKLVKLLADKIGKDSELKEMIKSATGDYKQYNLLTAQTILWCMQNYWNEISKIKTVKKEMKYKEYIELLKENHNLVLTGAPGTGKTYMAKAIAEEMGAETEFVQFHPSYDYTDFVEGLRPIEKGEDQVGFRRMDGIFKRFCKKAILNEAAEDNDVLSKLNGDPKVWKVSLAGTGDNPTRTDCLNNGYIRIGWHEYGDVEDFNDYTDFSVGGRTILRAFQSEMQVGDIVVSCYSQSETDAIGIVTGDYEYREEGGNLPRYRTVEWLIKNVRINIQDIIGKRMTLSTIYKLNIPVPKLLDLVKANGGLISTASVKKDKPYVMIIDEINRGELSKIFGELFFAIDPGYRGTDGRVKTQYQNLVEEGDVFDEGFYVPDNVYILATMNDIDRSVESMDFAMRRRFTWKEVTPDDTKEMLDTELAGLGADVISKAKETMKRLNNEIAKTDGLGAAFMIGPSYFLKLKSHKGDFEKLWKLNIQPLLKEYLRGFRKAEEILKEFEDVYFNFNDTIAEEIFKDLTNINFGKGAEKTEE